MRVASKIHRGWEGTAYGGPYPPVGEYAVLWDSGAWGYHTADELVFL